jgi:shikimate kinase
MGKIIVLYGLPCTGKTTISNLLVINKACEVIRIDDIWLSKYEKPTFSVEEGEIVFKELVNSLIDLVNSKKKLILVEGIFASISRLEELQRISENSDYQLISILLFNKFENLIKLNDERNNNLKNKITNDTLTFLNNKFNSQMFCNMSINTGKVTLKQAVNIINNYLQYGK